MENLETESVVASRLTEMTTRRLRLRHSDDTFKVDTSHGIGPRLNQARLSSFDLNEAGLVFKTNKSLSEVGEDLLVEEAELQERMLNCTSKTYLANFSAKRG